METIASSSHLYAAQIKEYGYFLKDYDQKLAQLQLPTTSNGAVPSIVRLKFACENEKLSTARMIENNGVGKPSSQTTNSNGSSSSSNVPLHKILSTFGQLCREIDCLEYEIRSLVRSIYERTEPFRATGGDGGVSDCAPLMWIAQNMDLMATVQCHYERLRDVGVLLLRQIGAFFDEEASYGRGRRTKKNGLDGKSPPSLEVDYLFDYIGRLLRITLELDHIIWKTSLKSHWRAFGQKLRQPTKTALPQNKPGYRDLLFVCQAIGFWIGDESTPDVTGEKRVLEALYRVKTKFDPVCSGEAFSDRFMKFLKRKFATLAADLRVAPAHGAEVTQSDGVIGVNILLNFALHLFLPIEQRMMKSLCELNMKFPLIPLEDNFPWLPDEFVQEQGHKLLRDYDASAAPISVSTPVANSSHDYDRARDGQLQALEKSSVSAILCLHAASWLVEAHVQLRNRPPGTAKEEGNFTLEKLRLKCALLLEGIRLVHRMEHVLRTLHDLYGRTPTEKTDRLILYRRMVVEFLLSSTHRSATVPCLQFIIQHQQHKIHTIISSAKKKLLREAKESKTPAGGSLWLEKLSTIDVLEKCLHGPATPDRVGLAQLTICLCHGEVSGTQLLPLSDDAFQKVASLLERLTTFIAWERECDRRDVVGKFTALLSGSARQSVLLSSSVVPMSNRIEAFIRWDFHGKWHQIEPFDPFHDGTADGNGSLAAADQNHTQKLVFAYLRTNLTLEGELDVGGCSGKWFSARHSVAQHLSDVFYTLSTISPSEWRIYREMRTIVDRKYGVRLVDDQLPRTTAEDRRGPRGHGQDDDILALMEDFETFIGSYGYDLHGQLFIERQLAAPAGGGPTGGGVVNVVKIEHIANSIKRHGPGIISTVVNYAFQFLRQKLFTFSHFLYDEQIHSRLAADAKKLSTESTDGAGTASTGASTVPTPSYTYDRALAFNRRIRNLGLSDDGETYIDLFRKLICQIGNAMAFVRLLHSGALHECTGAAEFLSNPSMSDEQDGTDSYGQPEGPHDTCSHKSAVTVWKQDMAAVRASWRLENEFFRLLLNAFDGFRRRRADQQKDGGESAQADNFAHLELFYLIIPPLTISYVEAMLKAKETIAKKDRHGTFLPTDDGFVMGLSYLLTLLNQTAAFNSLHWFKEVHTKYAREMAKLNQQSAGTHHLLQQSSTLDSATDEKMLPTVSLTRKRLNAMQHEFELLQYNLSSSKIFFK
ncbi:WASH complex subunit 4 [Anopheles ziemanni]|uniref:WASH complex subunit 4 n=1 Tax=Anopheles coustani TaxID=139045 RepID=UPI002658CA6F|nr:WASH complex subunit 4 [Anopheles coustani]XP_058173575.1 WASH complex subunit 4 [Anopheles ziemanni]